MGIFKSILPKRQDTFIVFSTIVFVVFSWSIRGFFFIFPSVLLRYAVGEIIAIFSYMMAFAFLESLLIIGFLILISIILPKTWLREGFSYKVFLIVLLGSLSSIQYQSVLGLELPDMQLLYLWAGILMLLMISLLILSHSVKRFQDVLASIAKRFTVFAYLYVPIGILGLIVVIFRNIFNG